MIEGLQEQFRDEFIRTARERIARSASVFDSLSSSTVVCDEMHALAGEASLIGFVNVAGAAREVEELAKLALEGDSLAVARCARAFRELRRAVRTLAAASPATEITHVVGEKVIVLDDSDLVRSQIAAALAHLDIGCYQAGTLDEALMAISPQLAVFVTDVNLPEASCASVVEKVRVQAPQARVVLMSGMSAQSLSELARELGADDSTSKMNGVSVIANRVAELLKNEATDDRK